MTTIQIIYSYLEPKAMIRYILESNIHKNLVKTHLKITDHILDDRFYAYATCFTKLI